MSPLQNAGILALVATTVLLWVSVRNINKKNSEFRAELDCPKGQVVGAFIDIALIQIETHLTGAHADSNVRFKHPAWGVLTVTRKRNRQGDSGYILRWEDRRSDARLIADFEQHARQRGLEFFQPDAHKVEIEMPDSYLRLEDFIETLFADMPEDDINTVLTWVCKGKTVEKDTVS